MKALFLRGCAAAANASIRNFFHATPQGSSNSKGQQEEKENSMANKKSSSSRKKSSRKYGKAAGKTVESAMRRKKKGTLKSGKGGKGGTVKSRKQAIAIGLSEARKKGAKVPKKKSS
jgi:hypothetical protein